MTTIAWDGNTLAADRQATRSSVAIGTNTKIKRLPDGRLVGVSGNSACKLDMFKWVESNPPDGSAYTNTLGKTRFKKFLSLILRYRQYKRIRKTESHIIEVHPNGDVWLHDNLGSSLINGNVQAIGSGSKFALGAMLAGASADRAVEIATHFDVWSSGAIDTLELHPGTKVPKRWENLVVREVNSCN